MGASSDSLDLSKYPEIVSPESNSISVGDLYGNTLKLIYFLVKYSVIVMGEETYIALVEIYKAEEVTTNLDPIAAGADEHTDKRTQRFLKFSEILQACYVSIERPLVRFLGNTLASRGCNDYFTLLVFDFLQKQKVKFEILLSRNDAEFINLCELRQNFLEEDQKIIGDDLGQSRSLSNLSELIHKEIVTREQITNHYHQAYIPYLKLLSCDRPSVDKLTIYSYAPISIRDIFVVAKNFGIVVKKFGIEDLVELIEEINRRFSEGLTKDEKLFTILDRFLMALPPSDRIIEKEAVERIISPHVSTLDTSSNGIIQGGALTFVHSGSRKDAIKDYINLTSLLGYDGLDGGLLPVHYSRHLPLAKAFTPEASQCIHDWQMQAKVYPLFCPPSFLWTHRYKALGIIVLALIGGALAVGLAATGCYAPFGMALFGLAAMAGIGAGMGLTFGFGSLFVGAMLCRQASVTAEPVVAEAPSETPVPD